MNKSCKKIIIESSSGYFCRSPWSDRLAITRNAITYDLKIRGERFDRKIKKTMSWKSNLDEDETNQVEKVFSFVNSSEFALADAPVLDGCGLAVKFYYEDDTKEEIYTTYGDYVDEHYGDLFKLLQMISPLISKESTKPDYFNASEEEAFGYIEHHLEDDEDY